MSKKILNKQTNVDPKVVADFGREWKTFNHNSFDIQELNGAFDQYFNIFPFEKISHDSSGFDMGCGSGRWAQMIAPKVRKLHCIDASDLALTQAENNLSQFLNCEFECASVSDSKLESGSPDFGYCLGVLHHIPNTLDGIKACATTLKSGAPFLLYLYYRFDNKPFYFQLIWQISDFIRQIVSRLPFLLKLLISQIIAVIIYYPLSRMALFLERCSFDVSNIPLSDYRDKSFYILRTDALDRFGTRLEKRFTKAEITEMMAEAGFIDIQFSSKTPFWVAVGIKS